MSFVLFSSLYFGSLCFPGRVLLLNFEYGSRDDSLSPISPKPERVLHFRWRIQDHLSRNQCRFIECLSNE
uniref:Uncharacterized protein n=1 Tax=Salix viminalis TaxID=40686 RepID=A0A6N2N954_SALVM